MISIIYLKLVTWYIYEGDTSLKFNLQNSTTPYEYINLELTDKATEVNQLK